MIIHISDDFDLNKIAASGQCFRWIPVSDGTWLIPASGKVLRIREIADGVPVSGSEMAATAGKQNFRSGVPRDKAFQLSCSSAEFESFWKNYFDLETDYRSVRKGIPEDDSYLRRAAEAEAGIRILRQDPWETLVTFILSQRKNIPAIRQCVAKVCEAAGDVIVGDGMSPIYTFPSPEQILQHADRLESCGLGYRLPYVLDAARWAIECPEMLQNSIWSDNSIRQDGWERISAADHPESPGRVPESMSDDELRDELCRIRGVGIKVASCTMLFGYHRMNAFPVDVWMQRTLGKHYPGGFALEKYRPWAGLMQQYLFMAARDGI